MLSRIVLQTLLCLELIWTENNLGCDDSTIRTQLGKSVSNFSFFPFGSCFPPISKRQFGSKFEANFWLPYITIRVSATPGAPPSTSWCPLWWVLLKNINCRLLQKAKASCIDNLVLSCHALTINLTLSPQRELIKRIKNNYRNLSTIPCNHLPTILSRHIATAFLATAWQGNRVGW